MVGLWFLVLGSGFGGGGFFELEVVGWWVSWVRWFVAWRVLMGEDVVDLEFRASARMIGSW